MAPSCFHRDVVRPYRQRAALGAATGLSGIAEIQAQRLGPRAEATIGRPAGRHASASRSPVARPRCRRLQAGACGGTRLRRPGRSASGVPQIYYVGLLAGENDQEAAARTGDGREVNRHNFSREGDREAVSLSGVGLERLSAAQLERGVRWQLPGASCADDRLTLAWATRAETCVLDLDVRAMRSRVALTNSRGLRETFDL